MTETVPRGWSRRGDGERVKVRGEVGGEGFGGVEVTSQRGEEWRDQRRLRTSGAKWLSAVGLAVRGTVLSGGFGVEGWPVQGLASEVQSITGGGAGDSAPSRRL